MLGERAYIRQEYVVDVWTEPEPPDLRSRQGRGWFHPAYDPIRDDPWFQAILEEFGLADFELQRLPSEEA